MRPPAAYDRGQFAHSGGGRLMRNLVVLTIRLACVLSFASSLTFGQATGSLSGSVVDTEGAAIPGADVEARENRTGVTARTVSSEDGVYVFPSLPPGIFTVTAEKQGFKKLVRTDIEIFIAQRQALTLQLEIGDVKQSIEVSTTQSLLET